MKATPHIFAAAVVAAAFGLSSVSAQAQNVRVGGVIKANLADVKPDTNVAITSKPRPDGTLEAVELRIFPAGQPFNSFQGDWDLMPNSRMTNGALQTSVAGVDGQMLTVKYKVQGKPDEEKKIVVTPKTIIATTVPGNKDDLKPGLKVFVAGAPKLPDGSLDVAAIQVEKEIPPPQ